jgi:hypothetical protein
VGEINAISCHHLIFADIGRNAEKLYFGVIAIHLVNSGPELGIAVIEYLQNVHILQRILVFG